MNQVDLQLLLYSPLTGIFVFLFGLVIGSFLNVCIYRIPIKKSIVFPPSACPVCGHKLKWYENIPVLSYLFLRGRCSSCGTRISPVYPIVELFTGVIFLLLFLRFGISWELLFTMTYASSMIVISGIDLKTQIVPDILVIVALLSGIGYTVLGNTLSLTEGLLGMVAGSGSFFLISLIFYLLTKKIALGGGDIKLIGVIGLFTGWKLLPFVMFVASLSGIAYFFFGKYILKKEKLAESITAEDVGGNENDTLNAIPFAPFLALGGIVALFVDFNTYL